MFQCLAKNLKKLNVRQQLKMSFHKLSKSINMICKYYISELVKCNMLFSIYFRHVMLPKDIAKRVPKTHLMSETEWRNLGVQQSQGWVHYMIHHPGMCVCSRCQEHVQILMFHCVFMI